MVGGRSSSMVVGLALVLSPCVALAEPPTSPPPVVAGAVPSDPAPTTPGEQLAALRQSVERADFQSAAPQLEALLASAALTARERNLALELSAVIALAARRDAEAQRTLHALYARDPGHKLGVAELGPQISAAFERAAQSHPAAAPVTLTTALAHTPDGRPALDVHADDPGLRVEALHAYVWFEGERLLSHLVSEAGPSARFFLPARPAAASRLELHLEARAPSGALLGLLGERDAPILLALPAPSVPAPCPAAAEPPLRRRWWVWTSLGIAVAGIATGSAIAAR
jgi:hypothetical protein